MIMPTALPFTTGLFAAVLATTTVACDSTDDADAVAAARADLDALYKGDYRNAFVEKNPELFLRHIHDDFTSTQVDGSTANAEQLRQFIPIVIGSIERVLDHNVTIESVYVTDERIEAVVTLTTVMDRRSQAGVVYNEIAVSTYLDTFERSADDTLMEIRGEQLRSAITGAPVP
jgi:hypothetical protein